MTTPSEHEFRAGTFERTEATPASISHAGKIDISAGQARRRSLEKPQLNPAMARMTDHIRIIKHEAVPICGSWWAIFEGCPGN
jgi:hypothetical protein